uniref:Uncharacterized protein n=1 Tax=Odontella aurita TaxID=265563 RepID=A0A7S4KCF8_9STRA|mmetsp:Transcript_9427/g.28332  ORF Transcript_9427/g.28332 Transcript_9427/m.28332 type:complete len:111 (+) Transcript_9427:1020-1352(+)
MLSDENEEESVDGALGKDDLRPVINELKNDVQILWGTWEAVSFKLVASTLILSRIGRNGDLRGGLSREWGGGFQEKFGNVMDFKSILELFLWGVVEKLLKKIQHSFKINM